MPRCDSVLLLLMLQLLLQYRDTMGDGRSAVSRQPADLSQRNCLNSQSLCEDTFRLSAPGALRSRLGDQDSDLLLLRYSDTMGVTSVVTSMVNCCVVLTRLFDVEKLAATGRLDEVIAAAAAAALSLQWA